MKLLTHNFLNCAAKPCKASPDAFPLKFEEVVLNSAEVDYNPEFIRNVLARVDWPALVQTSIEVADSPFVTQTDCCSLEILACPMRSLKIYLQRKTMSCYGYCTRFCWK